MSINVPIEAVANQEFTIVLEGARYNLSIKQATGCMEMDIIRDDVVILTGIRPVAGSPVIPYKYLERGNFLFLTENDDLPWWEKFGATQSLLYLTIDEMEQARAT